MKNRREFIKVAALTGGAVITQSSCFGQENEEKKQPENSSDLKTTLPVVISTWNHGIAANAAAWEILEKNGSALDAVEQGVKVSESDPNVSSVGLGGAPDREGNVTLDACIMDHKNNCGAVAYLQHIENPISVARKVMEDTPHVMLVGEGALNFALEKGFEKKNLLTKDAEKAYEKWLRTSKYKPIINIENHDTIGLLALDKNGDLSGACTTSGMAYKLQGRVGDSPIIGAGLFVDNEIGAACATGVGEAVIRIAGSAIVVELMRQGKSPYQACKEAVERIIAKHENVDDMQVGFIALNKKGEHGGYSVYNGFNYALKTESREELVDVEFIHNYENK